MEQSTFTQRLESGLLNNLVYSQGGNEGLVSIWKYKDEYILTREECPKGCQYDESTYIRDERHVFQRMNDLLSFMAEKGLEVRLFQP